MRKTKLVPSPQNFELNIFVILFPLVLKFRASTGVVSKTSIRITFKLQKSAQCTTLDILYDLIFLRSIQLKTVLKQVKNIFFPQKRNV